MASAQQPRGARSSGFLSSHGHTGRDVCMLRLLCRHGDCFDQYVVEGTEGYQLANLALFEQHLSSAMSGVAA